MAEEAREAARLVEAKFDGFIISPRTLTLYEQQESEDPRDMELRFTTYEGGGDARHFEFCRLWAGVHVVACRCMWL